MLYLISAPPRTGKSLKAIEIIFKYLNQGRVVYTNIIGIKIPGVITFTSSIQEPHDWRDLPNNSVIIYDEAHEHPAFADRNLISDKQQMQKIRDIGISLTLHGHFGFDIYMITQNPRLLCAEVLASVGTHYIMRRKFGYDMATIFEYAEAKTTFSKHTAGDALNRTFWKYPKHLYKFYKSSEVHNIKKTFPAKYYAFALFPLLLIFYGINNAYKTGFFGMMDDKQQTTNQPQDKQTLQQKQETATPNTNETDTQQLEQTEQIRVASVFLNGDKCRAYNGFGDLLDVDFTTCADYANNPFKLKAVSHEIREQRLQAVNYQQYNQQNEVQPLQNQGI